MGGALGKTRCCWALRRVQCNGMWCTCPLPGVTTVTAPGCVFPIDEKVMKGWHWHVAGEWHYTPTRTFVVVVYPASSLVSINGMLWRFRFGCKRLGRHKLERVQAIDLDIQVLLSLGRVHVVLTWHSVGGPTDHILRPVGLAGVRALQRWARRRKRRLAVAMALHARLGARSGLGALGEDLVKLVASSAC